MDPTETVMMGNDKDNGFRQVFVLPERPKRPLTAYNLFFQEVRPKLQKMARCISGDGNNDKNKMHQPSLSFVGLGRAVAAQWKVTSPEERKVFEQLAAQEKHRYDLEMRDWKRIKKAYDKQQQRQQQEAEEALQETKKNDSLENNSEMEKEGNHCSRSNRNSNCIVGAAAGIHNMNQLLLPVRVATIGTRRQAPSTAMMIHLHREGTQASYQGLIKSTTTAADTAVAKNIPLCNLLSPRNKAPPVVVYSKHPSLSPLQVVVNTTAPPPNRTPFSPMLNSSSTHRKKHENKTKNDILDECLPFFPTQDETRSDEDEDLLFMDIADASHREDVDVFASSSSSSSSCFSSLKPRPYSTSEWMQFLVEPRPFLEGQVSAIPRQQKAQQQDTDDESWLTPFPIFSPALSSSSSSSSSSLSSSRTNNCKSPRCEDDMMEHLSLEMGPECAVEFVQLFQGTRGAAHTHHP